MRSSSLAPASLILVLAACGDDATAPSKPVGPPPHVVLISIDTLRPDHMGVYGYEKDTTPMLDAFAQECFVFENAYTPSPNTIVAHASMITSLYPVTHGVLPDVPLDEGITTLAEVLDAAGYATAAFLEHLHWLSRDKGFAQGFDVFDSQYRNAEANNELAFAWLTEQRDVRDPKFLMLHYYDAHSDFVREPYQTDTEFDDMFVTNVPKNFNGCRANFCGSLFLHAVNHGKAKLSDEELQWVTELYDGGVRYTDHHVGALLDRLRADGWFDRAWIVISSDHGEEFREHGRLLHSQAYAETARVPLLVRPPGGTAMQRFDQPANLVDVVPTLLEATGLASEGMLQGRSLLPITRDNDPNAVAPMYFHELRDPENVSVRDDGFTLITRSQFAEVELYEQLSDPLETNNIAAERGEVTDRLLEQLREYYAAQLLCNEAAGASPIELSEQEIQELRALGYVNVRSKR